MFDLASLESLEPRCLFAGVTMITHGWNGRLQGFVDTAADFIAGRLGGGSHVATYVMNIQPTAEGFLYVNDVTHRSGTAKANEPDTGEIVLIVDWRSVDTNSFYSANYVAQTATEWMRNNDLDGVRLASLPIHTMALSRGTAFMDEVAKTMGQAGLWIDHATYADPRPIGVMGDPPPMVYENVAFADNYWRMFDWDTIGHNGEAVPGAYNLYCQFINDHHDGYDLVHLAPASYYNGTINLSATSGGEGPLYNDWWGNSPDKPARDRIGFYFSSIIGGPRPGEGVWAPAGGSGQRVGLDHTGEQWPNITDVKPTSSNINAGDPIEIHFLQQDRDSGATITFYADKDQNPFNNNFATTLGSQSFAPSNDVESAVFTGSTSVLAKGAYYIAAKVTDPQGHTRYSYSRQLNVNGPVAFDPFRPTYGADQILRVSGTDDANAIKLTRSPSNPARLVVDIDGHRYAYNADSIPTIYVYGKGGADAIAISEKAGKLFSKVRLQGDAGNDTIYGGSGDDTIFGGDGNDRILAGAGKDRIDAGLGTDRTYGQGGRDYFVNSKRIELMDFKDGDILVNLLG